MATGFERLREALALRYRVEREIGRGGMAMVYLAQDLKHHRQVAIKVLDPQLAAALGPDRFLREIEIVARLAHPHILPLHDSGEAGGFLYYVMPFVEGESLRDRLAREQQISMTESIAIGRAVADALSYAHRLGIVHRDIKPENILFQAGHAVVTDFGIARAITAAGGDRLSHTGLAIGTPAYMSPEQAAGVPELDARSDIYGLGCVLYEMLSGQPPFTGPTAQAVLARHAVDPVPPLRTVRTTVPQQLEAVVLRALAKVPSDRFQTAKEFGESLELSTRSVDRAAVGPGVGRRSVALASAVVVVLSLGGWWARSRFGAQPAAIESLAVLPLKNLRADPNEEYFVEGMQEALITELSKIGALKVISRTSTLRYRQTDKRLSDVARELNVAGVIEGSALREGDRVRITVQLIDGRTDRHLWAETFDRELRGVLALHSEVAREIADRIKVTLTPDERARLSTARVVNPRAYELYVLGRHHWNQRTLDRYRQAVERFLQALEHDPNYAPAYAALADAYMWLGEQGGIPQKEARRLSAEAIGKALALDETLTDAHISMGNWKWRYEWDWAGAEREFKRAVELNPGHAPAHQIYGRSLSLVGRFDDAVRELQQSRDLDPLSVTTHAYLGQAYLHARQYARAAEVFQEALQIDPNHVLLHHNLGELHLAQGRWAEAVQELEKSVAGSGEPSSHYLAMLGCAYARANRRQAADSILNRLERRSTEGTVSAFDQASLHVALSDNERALALLEEGYVQRDYWLVELKAWPWFDPLKSDPRFQDLLRRMRFPD